MTPPTLPANFVLFDERKTVARRSGRAAEYLEQSGKKGDSCNEKLPGKSDDVKVEIAALELLMGQEEAQICLGYIPTHAKRRGSRISMRTPMPQQSSPSTREEESSVEDRHASPLRMRQRNAKIPRRQ